MESIRRFPAKVPLAGAVFDMPVRLGIPYEVEGPKEVISEPIYSTGVGLLKYAYQLESLADMDSIEDEKEDAGFLGRFREFISRIIKN